MQLRISTVKNAWYSVRGRRWADAQSLVVAAISVAGNDVLIYGPGDRFAAHSDGGGGDEAPLEVRHRRVSLVVALNDGEADFSGGELDSRSTTARRPREPPARRRS